MTDPKPIGPDDIAALPGAELKGAALVKRAMADAKAVMVAQRGSVLSHPGLAERLVKELGYSKAGNWNGYVPPEFEAEGNRSESLRRTLLIELAHEAALREERA